MTYRNPISGYSKAPRGLSVPPRVTGVFTGTTISPSPPPRQRPDRYTIRAGQNLPDKEFRYLRTVIVTAAVYWGFGSKLLRHSAHVVKSFLHAIGHTLPQPSPGLVGFLQPSFANYGIFFRVIGFIVNQGPLFPPRYSLYSRSRAFSFAPSSPAYNLYTCLPLRSQVHTRNTWLSLLTTPAECRITSPLNLPAPGRCQTLYVGFTPSAESCVFSKQSPGPGFCDRRRLRVSNTSPRRHPFSLSYGVNLQSSLVRVTSSALACSASPPVSVSGTGAPTPP